MLYFNRFIFLYLIFMLFDYKEFFSIPILILRLWLITGLYIMIMIKMARIHSWVVNIQVVRRNFAIRTMIRKYLSVMSPILFRLSFEKILFAYNCLIWYVIIYWNYWILWKAIIWLDWNCDFLYTLYENEKNEKWKTLHLFICQSFAKFAKFSHSG